MVKPCSSKSERREHIWVIPKGKLWAMIIWNNLNVNRRDLIWILSTVSTVKAVINTSLYIYQIVRCYLHLWWYFLPSMQNKYRRINHQFLSTSTWKRGIPVKPLSGLWLDFEPPAHHATLYSLAQLHWHHLSQPIPRNINVTCDFEDFWQKGLQTFNSNKLNTPLPHHIT